MRTGGGLVEKLAPLSWEHAELIPANAWRLAAEDDEYKKAFLLNMLPYLPEDWGTCEFVEDRGDEGLIVLFTHDMENVGAMGNEARILLALAETHVLAFFGTEGAAGAFNIDPYRNFPDPSTTQSVAKAMMEQFFMLSPLEVVAISTRDPIELWGIEDPDLYRNSLEAYKTAATDYWDLIRQRAPVLMDNQLAKMDEIGTAVGGCCLSHYNYSFAQRWLSEQHRSHVGIRAASKGPSQLGRLDSQLKGEPFDESEARLWELFGDWK